MRYSTEEVELLRQHVLVNNFVQAVGCAYDKANVYLSKSKWNYEHALSQFLQEPSILPPTDEKVCCVCHLVHTLGEKICTPTNTPAASPSTEVLIRHLASISTLDNSSHDDDEDRLDTVSYDDSVANTDDAIFDIDMDIGA